MTRRQPKRPFAFRIIAVGCVVLWLAAVSACNLEAFLGCDSHGNAAAAHNHDEHPQDMAAANAQAHPANTDAHRSDDTETHHAPDAEGDSHEHDGKEDSCCSTLGLPGRFDVYYGMADNRIGVARLDMPAHLPVEAKSQVPSSSAKPLHDALQNDFPVQIAVKPIFQTRCQPDANSEQKRKQMESNRT